MGGAVSHASGRASCASCPERASASGLGETQPFATATHQVDHGGLAGHTVPTDSRVPDAATRCRPEKKLRLTVGGPVPSFRS
eukprot:3698540-Prymnesium_polylepis.1